MLPTGCESSDFVQEFDAVWKPGAYFSLFCLWEQVTSADLFVINEWKPETYDIVFCLALVFHKKQKEK